MAKIATATSTKELIEVWQQHCYCEFVKKDAKAALSTMSDNSHVLMVPLAIGGRGRDGVYSSYHDYFLAQLLAEADPSRCDFALDFLTQWAADDRSLGN